MNKICTCCPSMDGRMVEGDGPVPCEVMFVGEAPGSEEARLRRPFVGPSGEIFSRLLGEVGWTREEVYVTNVVKCRPTVSCKGVHRTYLKNRKPYDDEVLACSSFLDQELAEVEPRVIGAMGNFALGFFRGGSRISAVHGRSFRYDSGVIVVPLFHPAVVIYDPSMYPTLVEDLMVLRRCLE